MTFGRQWSSWMPRVMRVVVVGASCLAVAQAEEAALPPPPPPQPVPTDVRELLRVDESMRRFFTTRISRGASPEQLLQGLVDAILHQDGLNFAYDSAATLDARQTFQQRRGNCVSFSFLVVAMARDLGLNAKFQNVETETRWNRFGRIVAAVEHVNVRVESAFASYVIDLRPDLLPRTAPDLVHTIGDERAFAQLYSTAGFFELVQGRKTEALRYLVHATTVDSSCAEAWTNLGSFYFREGDPGKARFYFERALREDSNGVVALLGLIDCLRRSAVPDDLRQADKLDRRAASIRRHDPYYQEYLARRAQERGDLATADKLLRRAIALKDDDPEFFAQWVTVLQRLGAEAEARRAQAKLEKLRARLPAVSPSGDGRTPSSE